MNKSQSTSQSEVTTSGMKRAQFKRCPCCKSEDLVKFDVDYFCMDCDWNSILFDVYSGNFEKRIALMNNSENRQSKKNSHGGVIYLRDLISQQNEGPSSFENQHIHGPVTKPFSKVGGEK